jgi:RNA polymerase sigma factor (sigma-70 family)
VTPRPTDAALVSGFLDGDAESHRFVGGWITEVLRYKGLGLGADGEDIGQEVSRKLLVSLRADRFRGAASLRTYVWKATQRAVIDHFRARRFQTRGADPDQVPEPSDPSPDAYDQVASRQVFDQLMKLMGEECRRLFVQAFLEERPYVEIARNLNTTEGAIKTRMVRCRAHAAQIHRELVTSTPAGRLLTQDERP